MPRRKQEESSLFDSSTKPVTTLPPFRPGEAKLCVECSQVVDEENFSHHAMEGERIVGVVCQDCKAPWEGAREERSASQPTPLVDFSDQPSIVEPGTLATRMLGEERAAAVEAELLQKSHTPEKPADVLQKSHMPEKQAETARPAAQPVTPSPTSATPAKTQPTQKPAQASTAVQRQRPADDAELIENVLVRGDLKELTPAQRVSYYNSVCRSVGLNPLTKPFEYIVLNNKLRLYALRDATDQLRKIHNVSVTIADRTAINEIFVVTARATTPDGRTDESTGAVAIGNLRGENLANAMMKAETKAKRRVTLSICGLGFLDESEIDTVRDARPYAEPEPVARPVMAEQQPDQAPTQTAKDAQTLRLELYGYFKAKYGSDNEEISKQLYRVTREVLFPQDDTGAGYKSFRSMEDVKELQDVIDNVVRGDVKV